MLCVAATAANENPLSALDNELCWIPMSHLQREVLFKYSCYVPGLLRLGRA